MQSKKLLSIAVSGVLLLVNSNVVKADGVKAGRSLNNYQLLNVLIYISKPRYTKMFALLSKRCKKVAETIKINPAKPTKFSTEDRKKDYELFTNIETLHVDFNDPNVIQEDEMRESIQNSPEKDEKRKFTVSKQSPQEKPEKTSDMYTRAKRLEYVKGTFTADEFQQRIEDLKKLCNLKSEGVKIQTDESAAVGKEEKNVVKEKDQLAVKEEGESTEKENVVFVNVKVEVISPLRVRVILEPKKDLGHKTEIFDINAEYVNPKEFYDFVSNVSELIKNTPQYFDVHFESKCQNLEKLVEMGFLDPDFYLPKLTESNVYSLQTLQPHISKYEAVVCEKMPKRVLCKNIENGKWLIKNVVSEDGTQQSFKIQAAEEWTTFENGQPSLNGEEIIRSEDITDIVVTGDVAPINDAELFENCLLGADTFANCPHIKRLDLSKTRITAIESLTFFERNNMWFVEFPRTLMRIERCAFEGCDIRKLNLSKTNVCLIDRGAFRRNKNLTEVLFPATLNVSQGMGAFEGCDIRKLDLSGTKISFISIDTFANNKNLIEVLFPTTLEWIEGCAFKGCNIKGVLDLSDTKIIHVGREAFRGNNLEVIKLPERFRQYVDQTIYCGIDRDAFDPNVKFQIGDSELITYDELPENIKRQ